MMQIIRATALLMLLIAAPLDAATAKQGNVRGVQVARTAVSSKRLLMKGMSDNSNSEVSSPDEPMLMMPEESSGDAEMGAANSADEALLPGGQGNSGDEALPIPTEPPMTSEEGTPGTITVNVTIDYFAATAEQLPTDDMPMVETSAPSDVRRKLQEDEEMAPTEEEIDLLITNTLDFYTQVYMDTFGSSLLELVAVNVVTGDATDGGIFSMSFEADLDFADVPTEDEVDYTTQGVDTEVYIMDFVQPSGPFFEKTETVSIESDSKEEEMLATEVPTTSPTAVETVMETMMPTVAATEAATTMEPTAAATAAATTMEPTAAATMAVTEAATMAVTEAATMAVTEAATMAPTEAASMAATEAATMAVTEAATTMEPTTIVMTEVPVPEVMETDAPTEGATDAPTEGATDAPTEVDVLETETVEPTLVDPTSAPVAVEEVPVEGGTAAPTACPGTAARVVGTIALDLNPDADLTEPTEAQIVEVAQHILQDFGVILRDVYGDAIRGFSATIDETNTSLDGTSYPLFFDATILFAPCAPPGEEVNDLFANADYPTILASYEPTGEDNVFNELTGDAVYAGETSITNAP